MRAQELLDYFRSLDGGWVYREHTVDTFKAGDPATEVRGIAVGWMSYTWALRRAVELGCNVFVTHEPTYYSHRDNDESVWNYAGARSKRDFIEANQLVILRCHDLWDQFPHLGIPDAWAEFLGFSHPRVSEGYYRVFDGNGETAHSLAQRVASRTAALGQASVQLLGPANKPIHRVALGTGALTPFRHFLDAYQCDLAICTDDGFTYWRDGALAIDLEIPVIVVNHAVSEIYGIQKLADHLAEKFSTIPVHHIPQTCMYQLVSA
ncbi:MAG TPA: Nif3-like dinuclear metal center hexameric protein [Anaerolineae bacterium]|nr:Nif3-like dinuclear metal center hexameric protein [Anaerolineae bacterium]